MVISRTTSPATVGAGPYSIDSGGPSGAADPTVLPDRDRRPGGTRAGGSPRANDSRIARYGHPAGTAGSPATRPDRRNVPRTRGRPLPRSAPSSTVRSPGPPRLIVVRPRFRRLPSLRRARYARSGAVAAGGTTLRSRVPVGRDADAAAAWGA